MQEVELDPTNLPAMEDKDVENKDVELKVMDIVVDNPAPTDAEYQPKPKEIKPIVPPTKADDDTIDCGCVKVPAMRMNRKMWLGENLTGSALDQAGENVPYIEHQGDKRQYMRDMILGVNDGLVSIFLLIIGLAGGNASSRDILLAGITGAVAGAVSMALGEYLATKSQAEVYAGDIELEKQHFKYHRAVEIAQLRAIMQNDLSLEGELLEQVVEKIGNDDRALLKIMMAFEFGLNENDERSPIVAMLMSGALFIAGSLTSVVPFLCTSSVTDASIAAAVLSSVGMFLIGGVKTVATRGSFFYSGMENFIIGGLGAGLAFAVGSLYDYARS